MAYSKESFEANHYHEPNTGCWLSFGKSPYGPIKISWKLFKCGHHKGFDIRHSCDTPACVNPNHLSLGTRQQNAMDCVSRGRYLKTHQANIHKDKTHCPRNHPYNEANTIYYTTPKGEPTRECRECKKISRAKWLAKKKAENVSMY